MSQGITEAAFWSGFLTLIQDLCGNTVVVQDANGTREHVPGDMSAVYVSITARKQKGQTPSSSYAEAVLDDDGPIYETLTKIENITIRFRVESLQQTPGQKADVTAEKIKNGFFFSRTYPRLAALCLGLGEKLFEGSFEDTSDDLYRSVVILDYRFLYISSATDPTPDERIDPSASEDFTGGAT